jgi:hypothetical protein
MISLEIASIVTAFSEKTVGTKVVNRQAFVDVAKKAISVYPFHSQRVPGQGFVECPEALLYLSSGVGKRTNDPKDYHPVLYRGRVELFLKRKNAAELKGCALIVYTKQAYLNDPEVRNDKKERQRISESDCSHVLVSVLGFAGPKAPYTPYRLVSNLAGGNKEAETWSVSDIRQKARQSKTYWDEWCTVAD